jgi:hypothetical protein
LLNAIAIGKAWEVDAVWDKSRELDDRLEPTADAIKAQ